jgi:hypothetical protein
MRARLPLLAALALAWTSPAQSRLDAVVEPLFQQLTDPKTAVAAQARLERLGDKILPQLQRRLAPPRDGDPQRDHRVSVLYLLGRLGRAGLPAMREIVDTMRDQGAPDTVVRQAIWAMGQIGAFGSEEERYQWNEMLRLYCARHDGFLLGTVYWRLNLGSTPDAEQVRQWLGGRYQNQATAAAEHLAATETDPAERAGHVEALRAALDRAQPRPELPWEAIGAEAAAPYIALAWEKLSAAPLDGTAARALLRHFDPFQRRRGIAVLATAKLPLHERVDLLYLLWDDDPDVFAAAANALAAGGADNLPALAPLRWHARHNADAGRRAAAAATAVALVAACGADQGDAAMLLELKAPVPGEIGSDHLAQTFAALLLGAELCPDGTAARLIVAAEARSLRQPVALRAVLRLLVHSDSTVRGKALGYLASSGRKVLEAWPDAAEVLGNLPMHQGLGRAGGGRFIEAYAWIVASQDATMPQILEAMESSDPRRNVRALAEIVTRGADALAASRDVRSKLREWSQVLPPGELHWLPQIGRGPNASPLEVRVDLVPQVRALLDLADWIEGRRATADGKEPAWPALRAFAAKHPAEEDRPIDQVLAGPPDPAFARELAVRIEATASAALGATEVAPAASRSR